MLQFTKRAKTKGEMTLTTQNASAEDTKIVDEIMENAAGLPIESQYMLLMMAKAMCYTRDCVIRQLAAEQTRKLPKRERAN